MNWEIKNHVHDILVYILWNVILRWYEKKILKKFTRYRTAQFQKKLYGCTSYKGVKAVNNVEIILDIFSSWNFLEHCADFQLMIQLAYEDIRSFLHQFRNVQTFVSLLIVFKNIIMYIKPVISYSYK